MSTIDSGHHRPLSKRKTLRCQKIRKVGDAGRIRYEQGSTLITSQLPLSTWHDVIGEPTFADAILDRIVHNAYRLELSGQSLRKTMAKTGDENCQR